MDGFASRGLVSATASPSWAAKSSADNVDYALSVERWLGEVGDRLISCVATVLTGTGDPADLRVSWATIISDRAVFFLGGGPAGTVQMVRIDLATSSGRRRSVSVRIPINGATSGQQAASVPTMTSGVPIPPNAIRLPDGNILVDDEGNPYLIA